MVIRYIFLWFGLMLIVSCQADTVRKTNNYNNKNIIQTLMEKDPCELNTYSANCINTNKSNIYEYFNETNQSKPFCEIYPNASNCSNNFKKNNTVKNKKQKIVTSLKKSSNNIKEKKNTSTLASSQNKDPWNIGITKFENYYEPYDVCTQATRSFVEMAECGKFYRNQNCNRESTCGNKGNMFVQYSETLSLGVKRGEFNETEAMLRFIEFRSQLSKKGTGSSFTGITNFNNFLQFQNTVRSISGW